MMFFSFKVEFWVFFVEKDWYHSNSTGSWMLRAAVQRKCWLGRLVLQSFWKGLAENEIRMTSDSPSHIFCYSCKAEESLLFLFKCPASFWKIKLMEHINNSRVVRPVGKMKRGSPHCLARRNLQDTNLKILTSMQGFQLPSWVVFHKRRNIPQ